MNMLSYSCPPKPSQSLDHDGRGTPSTIADAGHPLLARFQCKHEMVHYPGPTGPQGVSQANCSSVNINLGWVEVIQLHVSQHDHTEGLVDLPQVHLVRLHSYLV